jgi:PAS domain S-box-containing protein
MNFFAILSLCISASVLGVGLYTYLTNERSVLNRVFFLFALSCSYSSFIEFCIRVSPSAVMAQQWCVLGAFRLITGAFLLHFILCYTGYFSRERGRLTFIVIYLPALALSACEFLGCMFNITLSHRTWGWSYDPAVFPGVNYLFILWVLILVSWITISCVRYYRTADPMRKKNAEVLLYTMGALCVLGVLTMLVDSLFESPPELTMSIVSLVVFVFAFFIRRYDLFDITLTTAARDIIKIIPEALFIADRGGTIRKVNDKAVELTGCSESRLIDAPLSTVFDSAALDRILSPGGMEQNQGNQFESVLKTGGGAEVPVSVATQVIRKTKKLVPAGVVIICKDITFEIKARVEFGKSQRLDTLSRLAGGISHDFGTLLSLVATYVEQAKNAEAVPEKIRAKLEKAFNASMRASDLTRQLATLSKDKKPCLESCVLPDIIRDALAMALSGTIVGSEVGSAPGLYSVQGDKSQLMQVFLNLFMNACQAMPDGGTVRVTAANVIDKGIKMVEVDVADRGIGIDAENQKKIFEPFFTTKPKSTGLGLFIVHSIIAKHNGSISLTSEKGGGTSFRIRLPVSNPQAAL